MSAAPYWIVVYKHRNDPRLPDPDASIFTLHSDLIAQIADEESRCCDHKVLDVIRVAPGEIYSVRDDIDQWCAEYLHDWDGERAHRESLRRVT